MLGEPLLVASLDMRLDELARRLILDGANVNASKGGGGKTALHVAVERSMPDMVRLLVAHGADVDLGFYGCSFPLESAAGRGDLEMVRLLLELKAKVDQTLELGKETALMAASRYGHLSVVELLLAYGADPDRQSSSGYTALHNAGMGGHIAVAGLLLSHGANPNLQDERGRNATDHARYHADVMVAQAFRDLGMEDIYSLSASAAPAPHLFPSKEYQIFISYKHLHFIPMVNELREALRVLERSVFVDRFELKLDETVPVKDEALKHILSSTLQHCALTVFFEIYWDGTHGEPPLSFDTLNWQHFELLHSRKALLISHERKLCSLFHLVPGEKIDAKPIFSFTDWQDLAAKIHHWIASNNP